MKAVVIGAGRIGCGLAGQLLRASGYELTFITRSSEVVDNLNRFGHYKVLLTSSTGRQELTVDGIKAIQANNVAECAEAIAQADVIVTAVFAQNLAAIAPLIAQGLARKTTSANVIAFENMADAGPYLRQLVSAAMPRRRDVKKHGFSGAVISRMVTQRLGNPAAGPLTLLGEAVEDFVVDRTALRAPLPHIRGMKAVDNYRAWVLRKLYTFSAGHATTAYLGWLKGYNYIHAAIRDLEIRTAVMAAMAEGLRGLTARFGKDFVGEPGELCKIVRRFENAALNDQVTRVGRDPHRKLGATERLVGAARLAEEAGFFPEQLALVTAAALRFGEAKNGQTSAPTVDVPVEALNQICGLDAGHGVGQSVAGLWAQLAPSLLPGNLLLSLDRRMWACI